MPIAETAPEGQGGPDRRTYDVVVRFQDGGTETLRFDEPLPYSAGDGVSLVAQGRFPLPR